MAVSCQSAVFKRRARTAATAISHSRAKDADQRLASVIGSMAARSEVESSTSVIDCYKPRQLGACDYIGRPAGRSCLRRYEATKIADQ